MPFYYFDLFFSFLFVFLNLDGRTLLVQLFTNKVFSQTLSYTLLCISHAIMIQILFASALSPHFYFTLRFFNLSRPFVYFSLLFSPTYLFITIQLEIYEMLCFPLCLPVLDELNSIFHL